MRNACMQRMWHPSCPQRCAASGTTVCRRIGRRAMTQSTMIVFVVVAVVALAAIGWLEWQRRRSETLRTQYGPEYDRAVHSMGTKRRAESELVKRQERVEQLDIRPLSASQRTDYVNRWRAIQSKFVDDPRGAVSDAD